MLKKVIISDRMYIMCMYILSLYFGCEFICKSLQKTNLIINLRVTETIRHEQKSLQYNSNT